MDLVVGVVTDRVKMSMNPFDDIALEEAIRWKEAKVCKCSVKRGSCMTQIASEITAVSIGGYHIRCGLSVYFLCRQQRDRAIATCTN